jgi:hypothetical protein
VADHAESTRLQYGLERAVALAGLVPEGPRWHVSSNWRAADSFYPLVGVRVSGGAPVLTCVMTVRVPREGRFGAMFARRGQVRRCPMRGSAIGNGNRVSATLDLTGKGRFTVVTGLAGQS